MSTDHTIIEIMEQCPICFLYLEDTNTINLPCQCTHCANCAVTWIVTKTQEQSYLVSEEIACMSTNCQKSFKVQDVASQFSTNEQELVNSCLFQVYLIKTQDIQKCPKEDCLYAGVFSGSSSDCKEDLECDICETKWRVKEQAKSQGFASKLFSSCGLFKNSLFTSLWKGCFTHRCPNCKVRIEKNGGCMHMTCSKCRYEFCSICRRKHPEHYNFLHLLLLDTMKLVKCLLFFAVVLLAMFGLYQIPFVKIVVHWGLSKIKEIALVSAVDLSIRGFVWFQNKIAKAICLVVLLAAVGLIVYFGLYIPCLMVAGTQMMATFVIKGAIHWKKYRWMH